jgi:hypothetical protein
MKRPDSTFAISVQRVYDVYGCAEKREDEQRGLFGFHRYVDCPHCRVIPRGYEFWGENGHCQGSVSDRSGMVYWIARKVREQWRTRDHGIMGYRFRRGGDIHYVGRGLN